MFSNNKVSFKDILREFFHEHYKEYFKGVFGLSLDKNYGNKLLFIWEQSQCLYIFLKNAFKRVVKEMF
jgi:hypothetical protein